MAGSFSDDQSDEITGINITPLVDVMLVLLIIFMVTANYIVNSGIPVELPKASTGNDIASENLGFVLDKASNLYLNGTPIELGAIAEKLAERKATGKSMQALISADKDTPHGSVVRLIDTIRKNGVTDFAINVESDGTQGQ